MLADEPRQIQRQTGLAHAGAGCDEDQLALFQAQDRPVEIRKTGAQSGDLAAVGADLRKVCVYALQHERQRLQAADVAVLPQGIDLALCRLHDGVGLAGALGDQLADFVSRPLQIAQQGAVTHDGGILQHVRRRRRDLHELREILVRRVRTEHAAHLHLLLDGDDVDRLVEGKHGVNCLEDLAVGLDIKFLGLHLVDHIRDAGRIDQHGADDGLLRRRRMRHLSGKQLIHTDHPFWIK